MLPPSPLTDPDVQISRFRFLTGELRSQRCRDDTIRDSSVKKRSCQFSYPLPFRGQVCETQSSLPCCPSAVLSSRRPPFLDRIPARPVLRRHQYYEGATTSHSRIPGHLFVSLPGPTRSLRCSCSLRSAPERKEASASGQDHCSAGDPSCPASLSCGREWDLSGSQTIHPVPLPRSTTPAEPTFLATIGSVGAAPAFSTAKAPA